MNKAEDFPPYVFYVQQPVLVLVITNSSETTILN